MANILIVDDEDGFRNILQIVLRRGGHETCEAANANMALNVIQGCPPDLILLDDMMPGMSGGELCRLLKADSRYQSLPVIMHSANSRLNDPVYVASIGADGVLLKPCPPHDLLATVNNYLQLVG